MKPMNLAALAVINLAASLTANAQIVSFNFAGTFQSVSDENNVLPADITPGMTFAGTITYDNSHASDSFPLDSSNGLYRFEGLAANDFSMTLNFGGHTIQWNSVPPSLPNYIQALNSTPDLLDYAAREFLLDNSPAPGTGGNATAHVQLSDNSSMVLSSDALPTVAPVFSAFNSRSFYFDRSNGSDNYEVVGVVTSTTPVPEPAAIGLTVGLGLIGFAAWRRRARGSMAH